MQSVESDRNHLFISYAAEDWAFADWLARKLTAEGFSIWYDRLKLLGGESYPREIDKAIKDQTFRLLALLSRNSISKENPVKERTLALNLGKQRGIDFLIPLNLDGLQSTELDWMTSDLTFIPFYENWAEGLRQLLKKLDSIKTPRILQNPREVAVSSFLPSGQLTKKDEVLFANLLPCLRIPEFLKQYKSNKYLSWEKVHDIEKDYPIYRINDQNVLCFQSLPDLLSENIRFQFVGRYVWGKQVSINDIPTVNIVSSLLHKSLRRKCLEKGLKLSLDGKTLFFPSGLLLGNKIHFTDYNGDKTWLLVTGERTSRGQKFIYHLSPEFRIRQMPPSNFYALLRARIHIVDMQGNPLKARSANSRRKQIARWWWNHQWLNRQIAILHFLSEGNGSIEIGSEPEGQLIVASKLLEYNAPFGIADETLCEMSGEILNLAAEDDADELNINGEDKGEI